MTKFNLLFEKLKPFLKVTGSSTWQCRVSWLPRRHHGRACEANSPQIGNWRFDLKRTGVLRMNSRSTTPPPLRVCVMRPWFVVRRPACGMLSGTWQSCNRLRWLAWLADVREHHCSLCGCLNWFSPGTQRQHSLCLSHTGYLTSKPLSYDPIVSILWMAVMFWDWFMRTRLFVFCMETHGEQGRPSLHLLKEVTASWSEVPLIENTKHHIRVQNQMRFCTRIWCCHVIHSRKVRWGIWWGLQTWVT